ncbi:MAG: glycosyltransferase family 4 protein [Planctomycetes bacterium]|jgi:glycosyltransferase involved in cell wall biosynthesis|nr:glycosyltransferase family 4 protein [Planctomycetota bacterium]
MRIAIIGQKGIPATYGGVEKHVEELSIRLAKAGHEVYVYTRRNYTPYSLKEYKNVKLVSLPSISTKHLDAISHTFLACLDVLRREFDVVHFHSIGPSSLVGLIKLLKPSLPVVATFHSQCYHHQKWGSLAKLYLKFGEAMICYLPDATITISRVLERYAEKKYGTTAEYIPNGVKTRKTRRTTEIKRWELKPDEYIITVSRLIRHKGVHHLIKAYNSLKTDKKLVVVGDGSYTEDYVHELYALANSNPNIIFTGTQTGETLAQLFSHAYLFVQPSESEGLSISLLEAMSYGLPVLVSDIPENIEAVGRFGFVFKNKSHNDLKKKLILLLSQPKMLGKKAEANQSRVDKLYDWDAIAEKVIGVYMQSIIRKKIEAKRLPRLQLAKKFFSFIF